MNDKKIRERAEKAVKKTVEKAQLAVKNKAKEQKSSTKKNLSVKKRTQKQRGNRTKLLVSIVNSRDEIRLKEIVDDCSVTLSVALAGTGTARSQVLDYFGIGETEKTIVFSLFPESDEDALIKEIRSKMSLYLVGRGISFTVPLTGVSEIIANGLASAATEKNVEEDKIMTETERKYDLIIAAVGADHADEAMEAARSAGAAGGTILHARMLDNKKAEQFAGISLAREQEILMILSRREGKLAIMQALFDKVGVKTEAGGIIFSLPVDRTVGINADEAEEEKRVSAPTEAEQKEEKNQDAQ